MKKWLIVYFMMVVTTVVFAQNNESNASVDARVGIFPNAVSFSSSDIAKYIAENFSDNGERIRSAYRWVTANIEYDKDSMLTINWSYTNEEKIAATLRRKKGVCDNFASVFSDILVKLNIPSYVVNGLTKAEAASNAQAHSWCAVYFNKEWLLCDPTWDAAYINQPQYFLIAPSQFIYSHWPFDPLWQLLPYPITHKEFEKGFATAQKNKTYFNVNDSVKYYVALDSLQQLQAIARRMKATGLDQETLRVWYAYNQMNIAIINGENDMYAYNAAVADLNNANASLNNFIEYRNNFFNPVKPDAVIAAMLQPVDDYIKSAYKKADLVDITKENFQYDTGSLKDRLKALSTRLDEQNQFLKSYLAAPVTEREKLFYKEK